MNAKNEGSTDNNNVRGLKMTPDTRDTLVNNEPIPLMVDDAGGAMDALQVVQNSQLGRLSTSGCLSSTAGLMWKT